MHLIFRVVPCEDVHDQIDTETVGHFPGALAAIHGQKRLAVLIDRPGPRPVGSADEKARYPVAASGVPVHRLGLDPQAPVQTSREALDEIIALCQHMGRRGRLQRRGVDPFEQVFEIR